MYYVYFIRSMRDVSKRYVGYTVNIEDRLAKHNAGSGSVYTAQYAPWDLVTAVVFKDKLQALAFERYMKTGSGQALANKRFW